MGQVFRNRYSSPHTISETRTVSHNFLHNHVYILSSKHTYHQWECVYFLRYVINSQYTIHCIRLERLKFEGPIKSKQAGNLFWRQWKLTRKNMMMQRTSNENAACKHRICKRSDQPKIDRIANNDMIKFFSFFLGVACVIFEHITNVWQTTCRAQRAHLLRYWPWVWWKTTKRRL